MIPDSVFAVTGILLALAYLALGAVLLIAARSRLRRWPMTAYLALAGPYLIAGVIFAHRAGWRIGNPPGEGLDPDGVGTLAVHLLAIGLAVALIRRLWRGTLLTDDDKAHDGG